MELVWFGEKAIRINTSKLEIFLDVAREKIKDSKEKQLLLYSKDQNLGIHKDKNRFITDLNGEFEVQGVEVQIIPINNKKVVKLKIEGMTLCHLDEFTGDLSQKQQEQLNQVDVLLVPLIDLTNNLKNVLNLISKVEPKIVIPIGYKSVDEARQFFKNQGVDPAQAKESYRLSQSDLGIEERKTILLKPQSL